MRAIQITAIGLMTCSLWAQDTAEDLLSKAIQHPNDERIIGEATAKFLKSTDPKEVISGLRRLFNVAKAKSSRQDLAVRLMILGQRDEVYFNELAKYALDAVKTTAPLQGFYDAEGNSIKIRGYYPEDFRKWCENYHMQVDDCLRTVASFPIDLGLLVSVKDKRAIPLLREALSAENQATVQVAIEGLALLDDTSSIPAIENAISRFRPKQQPLIASVLAKFDDPRVGPILDKFVKDPKWRQELDDSIRKRHAQAGKQ